MSNADLNLSRCCNNRLEGSLSLPIYIYIYIYNWKFDPGICFNKTWKSIRAMKPFCSSAQARTGHNSEALLLFLSSQCIRVCGLIATAFAWYRSYEALFYKPEGRGFKTRRGNLILSFYLILLAEMCLGFTHPLTGMNTWQRNKKIFGGVERGRRSWCSYFRGNLPLSFHGQLRKGFYFFLYVDHVRTSQETEYRPRGLLRR
jgi:hypothetical protein